MVERLSHAITVPTLIERLDDIPLNDEVLVARREELRALLSDVLTMFGPSLDGEEAGAFIQAIDALEQEVGVHEAQ